MGEHARRRPRHTGTAAGYVAERERIPTAPVLAVVDELYARAGGWPDEFASRTTLRMRGQEWCSMSTLDRLLTGSFERVDLFHLITNEHLQDDDDRDAGQEQTCQSAAA